MGGRFETGVIMGTAPCNDPSAAAYKVVRCHVVFCEVGRSVGQAVKEGDLLPAAKPRRLMGRKFEFRQAETFVKVDNQANSPN